MYFHYRPTKTDLIRGIPDSWDPCRREGTEHWYPLFYNYEAETIAQSIRKNSSVVTVADSVGGCSQVTRKFEEREQEDQTGFSGFALKIYCTQKGIPEVGPFNGFPTQKVFN